MSVAGRFGLFLIWPGNGIHIATKHDKMKPYALLVTCTMLSISAFAQPNSQLPDLNGIRKAIYHNDSLFWQAYNQCDVDGMAAFLTDDVEFYHDKGGPLYTLAKFKENLRTGLCGKTDSRIRRDVVPGTVNIFPMDNYGGLITGEHIFYVSDGKKETLDGYGKFTQLWKFENNVWKMSRILSYDHGPAPYINKRKEITVAGKILKQYEGEYTSPKADRVTINVDLNTLKISTANLQLTVYPETQNKFFAKDRDLEFEFLYDKEKKMKMVVYEKGNVVEEVTREQKK